MLSLKTEHKWNEKVNIMTTVKFDQVPTAIEETNVNEVDKENMKQAWQAYEAKPEYKDFNKHDLIESMLDEPKQ